MKSLLIIVIAILFTQFLIILVLWKKNQIYRKTETENQTFFKIIISYIDAVRYGKLMDKISVNNVNGYRKNLAESINRMVETLADREKMIQEYEKIMTEKTNSLEQFIKKEQDTHILRQDFIATLGHDLKVPIIAASNTLDFLIEGTFGKLTQKQEEAVQKMKSSNSELIELVENILATYRSEEQNLATDKTLVNLQGLIQAVVDELSAVAERNNQKIETNLETQIYAPVDAFQIKRVIKNLLFNALSYCAKNSNVIISLEENNQNAIINVVDFGQGIDTTDLPHIFEKYYSCAKKFRKVGTGLGLYLAKQIIAAHNGSISVKSTPHEKTVFTVTLPLK